jgi:hypothetical protein
MAEKLGMNEVTAATDNLFAGTPGQFPEIPVEIAAGEGVLARGTVLGKIIKGAISLQRKRVMPEMVNLEICNWKAGAVWKICS